MERRERNKSAAQSNVCKVLNNYATATKEYKLTKSQVTKCTLNASSKSRDDYSKTNYSSLNGSAMQKSFLTDNISVGKKGLRNKLENGRRQMSVTYEGREELLDGPKSGADRDEDEIVDRIGEVIKLKHSLNSYKTAVQFLEQDIPNAEVGVEKLLTLINQLESDKRKLQRNSDGLQRENLRLEADNSKLKDCNEQLKAEIERLTAIIEQHKATTTSIFHSDTSASTHKERISTEDRHYFKKHKEAPIICENALEKEKEIWAEPIEYYKDDIAALLSGFNYQLKGAMQEVRFKLLVVENRLETLQRKLASYQSPNTSLEFSIEGYKSFNPLREAAYSRRRNRSLADRQSLLLGGSVLGETGTLQLESGVSVTELVDRLRKRTDNLKKCMEECRRLYNELENTKAQNKQLNTYINKLKEKLKSAEEELLETSFTN
eukprot:TRINITY_DN4492_c0_g1_i1.p1 TRINITY_DN4492_c0_g1~~TRINITY_DN4492_c0_g1_i1.p1  ORF type:complete len:470 (+),score=64.74 TRINITY_DN4492_c0_g1_i1:109-1410(+)